MSPVFALLIASQPSVALSATLAPSNIVSACSGVSLPASAVTSIIAPVLTGTVTPLQTSVNGLLAGILGSPTTFNLSSLLSTAASGQPITLQAISNNGTLIGPSGACYSQATGFTLAAPAGIAIGGNQITGLGNNGATATAGELNSIAFGNGSTTSANATGAVALGTNSAVNGTAVGGVALGNGAVVSAANSVAIGASSTATRGALSNYAGYALSAPQNSAGEVSVGVVGGERQLTNVAAGLNATDAVNVAQLTAVNGQVTTNTAGIASLNTTVGSQGTQIATNTNAIGTLSNLAVEYTDPTHAAISLGGTGAAPVALDNLQAGALSATSTAAVNGSQLFATNANVATNTAGITALNTTVGTQGAQIATNTNAIDTLSNIAVEYTDPTHSAISLGGTGAAPVALGNLQAGALSATSTDAVNGSQLFTTNANVTNNTNAIGTLSNLAVEYTDPTHVAISLGGTGSAPVALGNLQAGVLSATSTDAVNGGQLFATNANVATNTAGITALNTTVGSQGAQITTNTNVIGALSDLAVEYTDPTHVAISLGGTGSAPVALGNLQAGVLSATSTDAVNGSQLFTTNANVAINTAGLASLTTTVNGNSMLLTQQGNAIGVNADAIVTLRNDTADGAIGPVQYSNPLTPTTPNGGTATNDLTLVGRDPTPVALHNVADGVVAAGSTDGVNGGQLFALGSQIGSLSDLSVQYNDAGKTAITLGNGTVPVLLTNVQAGTLGATSTDAVNGSQLFATNTNVAANATNIASLSTTVGEQGTVLAQNSSDISTNADAIVTLRSDTANGAIGPVQYSFATTPTVPNGGTPTNDLTLVGATAAPVALHNVAAGSVAQGSTDAVNGGQLFDLSSSVGALSDLAVQYDDASRARITLSSATGAPVALTGVAAGALSATSSDAVDGAQLYATNQSIAGLTTDIGNGAVGPVRYSTTAAPTTSNGGVPSQDLTLVGAAGGPVALHNVADGNLSATSTDAVNGSQLFTTNQNVSDLATTVDNQTAEISTLDGAVTTNTLTIAQTSAALTQLDTAVANGGIGPVQYSSTAAPTTPDGGVPSQDLTLVGAASGPVALHNLAAGSLAAGSSDAVNGSQLGALGLAGASIFGGNYTYNPATNSYSGSFSYGGNDYSNIQAALGAIQTSVADTTAGDVGGTGIKYFHTTSDMSDSSATGTNSTAIGPSSVSSGVSSIAVGENAVASGDSAVAIGSGATAQDGEAVSIGVANFASGNGAVSIGDPNSATGDGSVALGKDNTANGEGAIALGNTNSATGLGAAAIGDMNISAGDGAAAIGYENSATGMGSIAIGSNNVATGDNSLAIGTNVQTTATDTLAIGSQAAASGVSAVTVGNRSNASGSSAVAVGDDAHATGDFSSAFGNASSAQGGYGLAEGAQSAATGFASTAIGTGANVTGFASTAIGTGSIASDEGSVALGSASQTTRGPVANYSAFGLDTDQSSAGEIAIARDIAFTDPVTGGQTLTGNRQITGVAAGSSDTDAVNVSQLRGVSNSIGSIVAAGLGGGSTYNMTTGQLTAPSYTFGGVTYDNVGSAIAALASNETGTGTGGTTGTGGAVTYSDPSHTTVALASTGTTIQNVAPGALTSTSTDAVNGSQLAATNAAVTNNATAISTLSTQVNNGAVGVVRYSNSSTSTTANGGTQSNDATLVGANTSAPVALHNVAAGSVATGSTDAVNGDQLATTNRAVVTAQTTANTALAESSNSIQYDSTAETSVTLGNGSSGAVAVHNVAPGISPTDAANVGQLNEAMAGAVSQANGYTDGRIAALSFDLKNVQRDANAGAAGAMAIAGMPQPYEAGKGMISMGAGTFQGQTAIAMGVAKAFSDGHTVVKLGATYNSRGMVGANAGVGWQF